MYEVCCRLREEATWRWLPIRYGAFTLNECESESDVAIWRTIRIFRIFRILLGIDWMNDQRKFSRSLSLSVNISLCLYTQVINIIKVVGKQLAPTNRDFFWSFVKDGLSMK